MHDNWNDQIACYMIRYHPMQTDSRYLFPWVPEMSKEVNDNKSRAFKHIPMTWLIKPGFAQHVITRTPAYFITIREIYTVQSLLWLGSCQCIPKSLVWFHRHWANHTIVPKTILKNMIKESHGFGRNWCLNHDETMNNKTYLYMIIYSATLHVAYHIFFSYEGRKHTWSL